MNNDKYLSISALTRYLKYKFDSDDNLRQIFLKGEISNLKIHSTGHLYFSLKDENSKINAIMFSTNARRLTFKPVEGTILTVIRESSEYLAKHVDENTSIEKAFDLSDLSSYDIVELVGENVSKKSYNSLLYQSGYLTIKSSFEEDIRI